jgi:hypothetical protein
VSWDISTLEQSAPAGETRLAFFVSVSQRDLPVMASGQVGFALAAAMKK